MDRRAGSDASRTAGPVEVLWVPQWHQYRNWWCSVLHIRGRQRYNWMHDSVYEPGGHPVGRDVYVCILTSWSWCYHSRLARTIWGFTAITTCLFIATLCVMKKVRSFGQSASTKSLLIHISSAKRLSGSGKSTQSVADVVSSKPFTPYSFIHASLFSAMQLFRRRI